MRSVAPEADCRACLRTARSVHKREPSAHRPCRGARCRAPRLLQTAGCTRVAGIHRGQCAYDAHRRTAAFLSVRGLVCLRARAGAVMALRSAELQHDSAARARHAPDARSTRARHAPVCTRFLINGPPVSPCAHECTGASASCMAACMALSVRSTVSSQCTPRAPQKQGQPGARARSRTLAHDSTRHHTTRAAQHMTVQRSERENVVRCVGQARCGWS